MCYAEYLTCLAKTEPPLTLFEHSNDVFQVIDYLVAQNKNEIRSIDLIRTAALTHDVGKLKGDRREQKWIHAPYSAEFLNELLDDSRFQSLLLRAGINLLEVDRDLLLKICEEHHNPSPKLLHRCKEAILVSVADALASAIAAGTVGSIAEMLRTNPYMQVNLELVKNLGFNKGWDNEVHRIDLPGHFPEDVFLADMIFRVLNKPLRDANVVPLLQKGSSLWVVGESGNVRTILNGFFVDPGMLYDSVFDNKIYDSILDELPPAGSVQADSIKYVLVKEVIACRLAISLYTRRSLRGLFEKYNLSHHIDNAGEIFNKGLVQGIDFLWRQVKNTIIQAEPRLVLPNSVTHHIEAVANKELSRSPLSLLAPNENILEELKAKDKKTAEDLIELIKLFDASGNYYRSLTNILLEYLKMQKAITTGTYSLSLKQVALFDGRLLAHPRQSQNSTLCPVCQRFPQEITATGLITGNPKMDSVYQTFRATRSLIRVCRWCFLVGYTDLPIASIHKEGQSIFKSREYIILTSPLSKDKLQWLVDFVRRGRSEETKEVTGERGDEEQEKLDEVELLEVQSMLGMASGYDELAVLGQSRKRLSNVKGFALPTINSLSTLVGIRVPFTRLVGEDKVDGAVRRELAKASMYDIQLATGAPSIHYNEITSDAFSVNGRPISIEEMRRSNIAYRIANRYARIGRYRQLSSGLFMLLLSNPRKAVTTILRKKRRENRGQYTPREDRIKELMEMAESIASQDWKFDLGLKIIGTLVEVGLTPKARSFRYGPGPKDVFTGVDLVKWIQRIKMIRDEVSARAWATMLINALKRGDLASKEYIKSQGGQITAPGEKTIRKILDLVEGEEGIIKTCANHKCKLSEFSRDISEMDYYLLFYYNQKAKEVK